MKNLFLTLVLSAIITLPSFSQNAEGDALIGVWEPSHGKGRVKIEKINDKYYGKVVWLKEPSDPKTGEKKLDVNNPDPALRSKPRLGLRVLKDFEYTGDKVWENGTIYDPENGETYNCVIKLKDPNTLDIRGYIGVSMFGRTDVWTRMK